MEMEPSGGYRELEHAADWELEVWAPTLEELLVHAAQGMYSLAGLKLEDSQPQGRSFDLEFSDAESLLVMFLNELLYYLETEGLAFHRFDLQIARKRLRAKLTGNKATSPVKEIKAATYHNLAIREIPVGLHARVVLDV